MREIGLKAPGANAAETRREAKMHYNSENLVMFYVEYDLLTYSTSAPESAIGT